MKIEAVKVGQIATVSVEIKTDTIEVSGIFMLDEDDFDALSRAAKEIGYRLVKDESYAEDIVIYTDET